MRVAGLMAGSMLVTAALLSVGSAHADTILWISDTAGNIGQVDVTTQTVVAGSVHNTGLGLTDIGFTQDGTLYGTTFGNLFSIDTGTGAATNLGAYGTEGGMNALVGDGASLLGASFADNTVYTITPASPGSPATFGTSPLTSAGDLAFSGGTLFESGVDFTTGADALVNVSTNTLVGDFKVGSVAGPTLSGVFGLADDGSTMYAVNGTEVYSVDLSNGVLTALFDYSGGNLTTATGTAFLTEASNPAPEPASLAILGAGLAGLGFARRRRRG